ncbi:hypothetical protein SIO70_17255 [Chitinophaga sancti]|uniref:hypothetical protein n=1 Tax=Chitinophaga sancti TaxID=1004 RepID=UPI002A763F82|nr:hypothetical protein [Chitinophaga sancti]WPQ60092.1 hypothetical protein SIO70_17255 [Chitinophaga sancti]
MDISPDNIMLEIQLKVPLVEIYYSKFYKAVYILWFTLLAGGIAAVSRWPILGVTCFLLCYPLIIARSYFKNYKITGEIILGYHHITANGERFLIKDMQNINVSIEREPTFSRTPVILSGTNNIISLDGHSFRMLLNNKDIEAVDFLVKVWEETYLLKVGHNV